MVNMVKKPLPGIGKPKRPEPKKMVGNQSKSMATQKLQKVKKAAPSVLGAIQKAYGSSSNSVTKRPSVMPKRPGSIAPRGGRPGTNKGGGVMPNFKGVMTPRKQPITRPVQPRRGGR